MEINDYLKNSRSGALEGFANSEEFNRSFSTNSNRSISKYLNRNFKSAKKVQNEILELRSNLQSYTQEIGYKSSNRKIDRNQILDFNSFNSRLGNFMDENAVPQAEQMRAPTQEELDRVIWEDG